MDGNNEIDYNYNQFDKCDKIIRSQRLLMLFYYETGIDFCYWSN